MNNSREALIQAAFEEFSKKGYEATTVAGVAQRAGVTTGAVYAHFSGKLELLFETVGLRTVDELLEMVNELAERPFEDAARLLSRGMATPPDARTQLLLDVIVLARRDPVLAGILREGFERYLGAIVRAADAGGALGVVDSPFPGDDLARVLALLTLGHTVLAALGARPPSPAAFSRLADLLLQSGGASRDAAPLALVRARAAAAERAHRHLDEAIVAAARDGHSLRAIGAAAGMSHERVRQLLQRVPRDNGPRQPS